MRRLLLTFGLFALSSALPSAAEPFALLTVSGDIKLNGKALPTAGAPNWPLDAGDDLVTGAASAMITFPDGMRITLGSATRLVLQQCNHCVAQFYRGALDYDKPSGSKAEICALGRPVRPAPGSRGSVTAESSERILLKVGGEKKVLTSGKCPCNLGAPWAMAADVAGAAATAGAASASRPGSSSPPPAASAAGAIHATRPGSSSPTP